jgi:hypothetical protein
MTQQPNVTPAISRRAALVAASALALGASLTARPHRSLAHQNETGDPLAGTTIETLSGGVPTATPEASLVLLRVTMAPGVIIPAHSHPGPVALYVESGLFGTEFIEGSGTVQPAAVDGTPVPAVEMAAGDDVQMPAGDGLFYDGAVHTMRNDGDTDLVLLVSALFANDAPGFAFADTATPQP